MTPTLRAFLAGLATGLVVMLLVGQRYTYHLADRGVLYRSDRLPPWRTSLSHYGGPWKVVE